MGRWSTKSVLFNGTTQYGTAGNVLNFERNEPHSWSFWVRVTDLAATHAIITKSAGTLSYAGYIHVISTSGEVYFSLYNNNAGGDLLQVRTTNTVISAGIWAHAVYTYDGSSSASGVKVYVNGGSQAMTTVTDNLTANITNVGSLQLGKTTDAVYLKGNLDDVAAYDKELTASEVEWIYDAGMPNDLKHANAPAGLVSWWNMGENIAGAVVPDQQGSNDITLVNSPTIQTDAPEGVSYSGNNISTAILPSYGFKPAHAYEASLITADLHTFKTSAGGGGDPTVYFKMRARDTGVAAPGYVTWVSSPDPDFGGLGYSGGSPTPVGIMVPGSAQVVARWEE
jgi:hypothetical protein